MENLFEELRTSVQELSREEAQVRLETCGHNEPARKQRRTVLSEVLIKFVNPLVIVLLIIGIFSLVFGERIGALFVFLMAVSSVFFVKGWFVRKFGET